MILHDISQAHAAFSSHVVCAPAYFGAARYMSNTNGCVICVAYIARLMDWHMAHSNMADV